MRIIGACKRGETTIINACLEKEKNNKVKAGMAIAEAHASVTSPIGHGGFNFV